MRNSPDVVPITPLLCSREEAGLDQWRIEKTKKGITYFVPGPVVRGKVCHATITVRKATRFYLVRLFDDEIDCSGPLEAAAFDVCLEKASQELFGLETRREGLSYRLFWELAERLPSRARLLDAGDLGWAHLQGVTEEFVEKFLILVAMVYSRAGQLMPSGTGLGPQKIGSIFPIRGGKSLH